MDYKEKYEMALEGIQEILGSGEDSIKMSRLQLRLQGIFPELQELEDEKTRKRIIALVNAHGQGMYKDDMLAWLKKQGEQKSVDKIKPKFKVGDKIYLKPEYRMPNDDTPIANTVKEIIEVDNELYKFDGAYIFIEDQDKYELVKQKPWSEEDDVLLSSVMNSLLIFEDSGASKMKIDWLKSLKQRLKE